MADYPISSLKGIARFSWVDCNLPFRKAPLPFVGSQFPDAEAHGQPNGGPMSEDRQ
jgi:hypothetical protein